MSDGSNPTLELSNVVLVARPPRISVPLATAMALEKINQEIDKMGDLQLELNVDLTEFGAFRDADCQGFQGPILMALKEAHWPKSRFQVMESTGGPRRLEIILEAI